VTPSPKVTPPATVPAVPLVQAGVRPPRIRRRRPGRSAAAAASDSTNSPALASAGTKLYVGNLNPTTTEGTLKAAFSGRGRSVRHVTLPEGLAPGRAHSFAFVEMGSEGDARAAALAMNGLTLEGHVLEVDEVNSHQPRTGRQPTARPRES
jgi:RNA recognition motif-containing protein